MSNFTPEQQLAIDKSGTNIIVSAGAGSGKTAVLSERVIRILKSGIDINKILVLTFTKDAASEMKNRIRNKIKKEGLLEQLDYIDSAYITTFDSYALSIVKKYHYLLNISNNVSIIDSSLVDIKKIELLDEIFNDLYGNEEFDNFISKYTSKDDKSIKEVILDLSNKMDLIIDKEEYLNKYIDKYFDNKYISNRVNEYKEYVFNYYKDIRKDIYVLMENTDEKYSNKVIDSIGNFLSLNNYEELSSNIITSLPMLPKGLEDDIKLLKKDITDRLKKLEEYLKYKNDIDLYNSIYEGKEYVKVIISIIKLLDEKIELFKKENDKYEFIDIAKMAIKVVRENEDIRLELKNYYYEIMIDEYQDTNDLQETFVNLIENDNVYVVGDIKQSIYRFRNANPNLFRYKYINYSKNEGGFKIDLLKNFRSRSEVLDDINKIFNRVMDLNIGDADYESSHQMVFGNTLYNTNGKNDLNNNLEVYTYPESDFYNDEVEAFIIGRDIINKINSNYMIMDKDKNELRKINYSDICIIMDRSSSFDLYKKIFEYLHIPLTLYNDETLNNDTDLYIIKNIVNLIIKINTNSYDTEFKYYMISILRSFLYREDDSKIFEYFKNNDFKNNDIYKTLSSIKNYESMSIFELINTIYDKFDIYFKSINKNNIESSIVRYEYILNIASSLDELGYDIHDFIKYIDDLIEHGIDVKYKLNTSGNNAVKLYKIHGSKGLEYPICYFSGYYKEFNFKDVTKRFIYDNDFGIILPNIHESIENNILKTLYENKYYKEEISEKIRLFYVSLTRAREKMIIVSPKLEDNYSTSYLVDDNTRIKYRSFYDIINSISNTLKPNIREINLEDINISRKYRIIEDKKITNDKDSIKITERLNDINYKLINVNRYSKKGNILFSDEEISNINYGTMEHYKLECEDFYNPKSDIAKDIVSKFNIDKNTKVYKEFEFTYLKDDLLRNGLIDLLLEYDNEIKIVDYKLSNIDDPEYIKQLVGYKEYISLVSDKSIKIYLYSISKREAKEL